jgi:carbonic anhydrase
MSCPSATAPINISKHEVSGKCDLKCDYNFQYKESDTCTATNRGEYVALSYNDQSGVVKYNTKSYTVRQVRVYHPSLHAFEGAKAAGEMIVVHTSLEGGSDLLVCLPLETSSTSTSSCAKLMARVVATMAKTAPANGDQTSVVVNDGVYNLEELVPKQPFYSYTATVPYQPCDYTADYVVFTERLSVAQSTMDTLATFVSANAYDVKTGQMFFYNEKGPGVSRADGIYIDCQPVGQSAETTTTTTSSNSGNTVSFSWKSPTVQFFVALMGFLVLLGLFKWGMAAFAAKGR